MISVCMATFNGEKYLRAQLESVLAQLGPEDEVVISDRVVERSLILHRRHGANATTGGEGHPNPVWKRVWIRLYCLGHLLVRMTRPLGAQP